MLVVPLLLLPLLLLRLLLLKQISTAATATAASASTSTTAASDKAKEELTNDIVLKGELDNIKKIVSAMEVNTLNSAKTATNDYKKGLFDKNKKYSYLDIFTEDYKIKINHQMRLINHWKYMLI